MNDPQAHLSPEQRAIVISVQAEFDRILDPIAAQMKGVSEAEIKSVVAQNVLRVCLEATIERLLPYDAVVPVDLAVRLASYCISALPLEAHDGGVKAVVALLPDVHRDRVRKGVALSTVWDSPRMGERPNVPRHGV